MDIEPQMSNATSAPEEAAKNISTAGVFGITPTNDKDTNNELAPEALRLKAPKEAEPAVHEYVSQSTEHAAVAKDDISQLNYVSRVATYLGDKLRNDFTVGDETASLGFKKLLNRGQLNDEDTARLYDLNQNRKSFQDTDYNLSGWGKMPADVAAGVVDFGVSGVRDAFKTLTQPSTYAHGIKGVFAQAGLAALGFHRIAGSTYNELPPEMDETSKARIAIGNAIFQTASMVALPEVFEAATPMINMLSPKMVSRAMLNPDNAVIRIALSNIGRATLAGGGMMTTQEAGNIVKDEMVRRFQDEKSVPSLVDALVSAAQNIDHQFNTKDPTYAERLATSAVGGGMFGALAAGAGNFLGRKNIRAQVNMAGEFGRNLFEENYNRHVQDVVLNGPKLLTGKEPEPLMRDVTPGGPVEPQIGDQVPVEDVNKHAVDVLHFNEGLHTINDVMNSTKMAKVSPTEKLNALKMMFDRAGITKFYTTITGMKFFGDTPEKQKALTKIIDNGTGLMQGRMNAPIEVDPVVVMDVASKHPEVLDHVMPTPESGSPSQVQIHLDKVEKGKAAVSQMMAGLGISPKDIEPVTPESLGKPNLPENIKQIPKKGKTESSIPYDLEGAARRTQELLDQKKNLETGIEAEKVKLEELNNPKNSTNINSKQFRKDSKIRIEQFASLIADIDKQIESLKGEVTSAMKNPQAAILLFGHWPEPSIEDSAKTHDEYMNAPSFTDAIRKVLPKAEVDKFEAAQKRAREKRVAGLAEAAKHEMDKIQDIHVKEAAEIRLQEEIERIEQDPNFKLIKKIIDAPDKSIYQINPKSLTDEQLKYLDNWLIKDHKIFNKKSKNTLESVANDLGLKSGDELLQILAKTPSPDKLAKARADASAASDEQSIRSQDDLNHSKIVESLRDEARNNLEEMKWMREQEWPATKAGIRRIALPLSRIEELEQRAREIVWQTPINKLNPRQWEVAAARSLRVAVDSIAKNELVTAFQAKENEALAKLIKAESHIQIAKFNRFQNFIVRLKSKSNRQLIKDAGPLLENAIKGITSLIDFKSSIQKRQDMEAFNKFAEQELKRGNGNMTIPDRMMDYRTDVKEFTPEQILVLQDRLNILFKQVQLKGKLMQAAEDREAAAHEADLDRLEEEVIKQLEGHRGNTNKNFRPVQGNKTTAQKARFAFQDTQSILAGKQNIFREMDREIFGGWFYNNFDAEIEGAGKYFEKSGYTYTLKKNKEIFGWIRELEKAHGEIDKIEQQKIFVPEFKDIWQLDFGNLTKGDLMTAYANRGQAYTKELLNKNMGGVTDEMWQTVLDRHLEVKDVEAVHRVFDMYRNLRLIVKEVQEDFGRSVDFIEGIPIKHRGIDRMGGYIRARHRVNFTKLQAKLAKRFIENQDGAFFERSQGDKYGVQYAGESTHQGYLAQRVGTDRPLDLSFRGLFDGLFEIVHDRAYRRALKNFWDKMDRDPIKEAMVKAVGEAKVQQIQDANLQIASNMAMKDESWYKNPNRLMRNFENRIGRAYIMGAILGKSSVIIKQLESFLEMFNHLGPRSYLHFIKVNKEIAKNLDKYSSYQKLAMKYDPSISKYFDGVDDNAMRIMHEIIPAKGSKAFNNKYVDPIKAGGKMLENAGFGLIGKVDAYAKLVQFLTIYSMIVNDHHPNYKLSEMRAKGMTDDEIDEQIKLAVQHTSTGTMIQNRKQLRAPVQDFAMIRPFIPVWNYLRNIVNNRFSDMRKVKWKAIEAGEDINEWRKTGDKEKAKEGAKKFGDAAGIALWMMLHSYLSLMFTKWAAGKSMETGTKVIRNTEDLLSAGTEILEKMIMSPFEQLEETLPLVGAMEYAANKVTRYGNVEVTNMYTQAASSVATCLKGTTDIMKIIMSHPQVAGFSLTHISNPLLKACLETESYVGFPLPSGGLMNAKKYLEGGGYIGGRYVGGSTGGPSQLQMNDNGAKEFVDTAEKFDKFVKNNPNAVDPTFAKNINDKRIQVKGDIAEVPKDTADSIKTAMSKGDWRAPDGLYGFTPEQWKGIQTQAPDLGLTENGRIAKDTTQQEKAIQWELQTNAHDLARSDIPVNKNTLFGAHRLGTIDYMKLFNAPADAKVKSVLGDALSKYPDLAGLKTVGQVKKALNSQVEANKLTVAQ